MRSMVGMGMASSINANPLMYSSLSSCVTLVHGLTPARRVSRRRGIIPDHARGADRPTGLPARPPPAGWRPSGSDGSTWTSTAASRRAAGSPSRRSSSATASPTTATWRARWWPELCARNGAVVSFGGGTLMRPSTRSTPAATACWSIWRRTPRSCGGGSRPIRPAPPRARNLAGGGMQEVVTMLARRGAGLSRQRRPHPERHPAAR